jgi:membrane associated rhomboid family serine protease
MEPRMEQLPVATVATARMAGEVTLVLQAIGISSLVERHPDGRHVVWVALADRDAAEGALVDYVRENPPPLPPPPPRPLAVGAVRASLAYLAAEVLVAGAASRGAFGAAWVDRGILEGPAFRAGQWWRPVTSLTLHADFSHLLANLGFGAVFLGLAARVYGWGVALCLTLGAAVTAGTLEAVGLPAGSSSLGASTAVFAALGLLAPVRWPRRGRLQPWMRQAATFAGAVSLLGLLGAGDPRVDVTAHGLGFLTGVLLAWPLRAAPIAREAVQRICALAAAVLLCAAWGAALVA